MVQVNTNSEINYQEAINAFKERGQRVVFNNKSGRFESLTTSEAKKSHDISDLKTLKDVFKKQIAVHGISTEDKEALIKALDNRAKDLNDRTVFFGRSKQKKSVKLLKELSTYIEVASDVAQLAKESLSLKNEATATPIPSPSPGSSKEAEQTKPVAAEPPAPKLPEVNESTPLLSPAATPPALPGKAPPPPPPMGMVAKQKLLPGEIAKPAFKPNDFRNKSDPVLEKEIETIKTYLINIEKVNGDLETVLNKHKELTEKIAANTDELKTVKENMELSVRIEELVEKYNNKESTSYELPEGGEIPLYSDEEHKALEKSIEEETAKKQEAVQAELKAQGIPAKEAKRKAKIEAHQHKRKLEAENPVGEIYKISYHLLIAYSQYRDQPALGGKKGAVAYQLIDEESQKEIHPLSFENTKIILVDDPKGEYIQLKDAQKVTLRKYELSEDGSLVSNDLALKKERKIIEEAKYGDFAFKDLQDQSRRIRLAIPTWKIAISNRDQKIHGLLKEESKKTVATANWEYVNVAPEFKRRAAEFKKVNPNVVRKLQLAPERTIVNLLKRKV